jgi:hypothetical protein
MLAIGIDCQNSISENKKQLEIKIFQLEEKIDAQEKEIRLLKTDIDIIHYGYDRGQR